MTKNTLEQNDELRQAYGLAVFAKKALGETEPTNIGLEKEVRGDTSVVIGYQHNIRETPIDLVSMGKIPLEKNKIKDKIVLLNKYAKEIGLSDNAKQITVERLTKFDNNQIVILPIPIKTPVKFYFEYNKGFREMVDGEVHGIMYCLNRDTLKFEYYLLLRSEKTYNRVKMLITDINTKVFIQSYSNKHQIIENESSVLQFNRLGYVKPIKIKKNNITYIIDNCFVYADGIIIGSFTQNGIEPEDGVDIKQHNENLKGLIDKAMYISSYIKYMLPYGVGEINDLGEIVK